MSRTRFPSPSLPAVSFLDISVSQPGLTQPASAVGICSADCHSFAFARCPKRGAIRRVGKIPLVHAQLAAIHPRHRPASFPLIGRGDAASYVSLIRRDGRSGCSLPVSGPTGPWITCRSLVSMVGLLVSAAVAVAGGVCVGEMQFLINTVLIRTVFVHLHFGSPVSHR